MCPAFYGNINRRHFTLYWILTVLPPIMNFTPYQRYLCFYPSCIYYLWTCFLDCRGTSFSSVIHDKCNRFAVMIFPCWGRGCYSFILVNRMSSSLLLVPELNCVFLGCSVLPAFTLPDCKLIVGLYFFSLYPEYECHFISNNYEDCKALAPGLQLYCTECVCPISCL